MITAEPSIAADECYRCGYALHGIADDQACPECGLLAARSRRFTDELHNTRPKWLRNISRGVKLVLLALLIGTSWPFVFGGVIEPLFYRTSARTRWISSVEEFLPLAGWDVAALLFASGATLLSMKERYDPADRADRHRRVGLRIAATAPLIAMALMHVQLRIIFRSIYRESVILWYAFWLVLAAGLIPMPLLLFLQLRSLAKRDRSAHLAEHCVIAGDGATCAILYMGVVLFLAWRFDWNLGGRSLGLFFWLLLVMSVAMSLFLLWSLYLLIRFAIAFHRAAKQLRQKWDRDDRSITSDRPDVDGRTRPSVSAN